ncbi:MAG: hypothetical protein Q7S45_02935 [Candidatus Curtissbacteria bacterium]|nr:hypothetical protein [Candidatus Curtissbacteria bacterium]
MVGVGGEPIPGANGDQAEPGNEAPVASERTEEQQKVEALFDKVSEVNQQLDGGLAYDIQVSDGTSLLLFRAVGSQAGHLYGAHSNEGPVCLTDTAKHKNDFLGPGAWYARLPEGFKTGEKKLDPTDYFPVSGDHEEWQKAFTSSRDSILRDRVEIERIRAKRTKSLDQALDIVSKPVDINAPPPAVGPAPQGS